MSSLAIKTNIKGEPLTIEDRFLSAKEVAETCGIAKATIYRAMDRNEFPLQHQVTAGRVGWLKSDVDEYMRVGWLSFGALYGDKIRLQRIENKAALVQANAA